MDPDRTVFVVDDDAAVREAMARLMSEVRIPTVTFASADEFLAYECPTTGECPSIGCLLLDVRMPGMSGLALQQALLDRGRTIPIIIVTGHGTIPMAVETLKRGAFDFFEKPFSSQALIESVQNALEESVTRCENEHRRLDVEQKLSLLTPRERSIVELLTKGLKSTEIAQKFHVSPQAVDARRKRAMAKLGVATVPELAHILATHSQSANAILK